MKKEYIVPVSVAVNLNSSQMMAVSLENVEYTDEKVDNDIEALGRDKQSIWDSTW
jgi:hypothetical protein